MNERLQVSSIVPSQMLCRISFDDEDADDKLTDILNDVLSEVSRRQVLVVCVGTDRSTGDAFGPIIGSKLTSLPEYRGVDVFGTLDEPVHAVNLGTTLQLIEQRYTERPFIIAVDACLGKFDHVGHITVERGPLRPGAGVKKSLPEFGDVTITGVVNVSGFMEYFVLQNTRLSIVMRMTDVVVRAFRSSFHRYSNLHTLRAGI